LITGLSEVLERLVALEELAAPHRQEKNWPEKNWPETD